MEMSLTMPDMTVWKYFSVALATLDVYSWLSVRLIHGAYLTFIRILLESIFPIKENLTTHKGRSDKAQIKNAKNINIIPLDHHLV